MEQLNENRPSSGPMSLVFTDKDPIDFRSHQKNDMWQGKEYEQVLLKLRELLPQKPTLLFFVRFQRTSKIFTKWIRAVKPGLIFKL